MDVSLYHKIIETSDKFFYIPSLTDEIKYYEVHADVVCSCPSGLTGAYCKHQWLLADAKKINLPSMPLNTTEDRHYIGY